jgi:hypothetical protein
MQKNNDLKKGDVVYIPARIYVDGVNSYNEYCVKIESGFTGHYCKSEIFIKNAEGQIVPYREEK